MPTEAAPLRVSRQFAMSQADASSSTSIVLRAPNGEVGWTLVELQGTVQARSGGALDGIELARLVRDVGLLRLSHSLYLAGAQAPDGRNVHPPAGRWQRTQNIDGKNTDGG